MSKVKVTVTMDLDTGEYETQYSNVTHPGEDMDAGRIHKMLSAVLASSGIQVQAEADMPLASHTAGQRARKDVH